MSARVVSVVEQAPEGGGETNGVATFTRIFLVQLSASDPLGADIALNAASIPADGDPWPYAVEGRVTPIVTSRTVTQEGERGGVLYKVTVQYSNDYAKADTGTGGTTETTTTDLPPWMQPAKINYDFSEYPISMQRDYEGKPVVNVNNEPFDPPIMTTLCMPRISIAKASLNYNPTLAASMIGTINSTPFTMIGGPTIAKGNARLLKFAGASNYYVNADGAKTPYYDVTVEIQIAPPTGHGWDKVVLNQGYKEIVGGKLTRALTEDGKEFEPQPILLALDGTRLGKTAEPVWLSFQQYQETNWSALAAL